MVRISPVIYSPVLECGFLGAVIITSAPFEVLIGTVRANDLILSWVLALGLLFFILLERKPVRLTISTAFFMVWFLCNAMDCVFTTGH